MGSGDAGRNQRKGPHADAGQRIGSTDLTGGPIATKILKTR